VARIADLLLRPGETFDFDGQTYVYPDIRLVYWCGGNPFHHHQDLNRLRRAFARPDTVVVHESFWTATARQADIVLPATMSIERDDFSAGRNDPMLFAMKVLTEPAGQARDDYAIFLELANRLGVADDFGQGRTAMDWIRHLYVTWQADVLSAGHVLPSFEEFWSKGSIQLPVLDPDQVLFADFRADPNRFPLSTPSGRIEIFSETIDGFGYADCPGHPRWLQPEEWLGSKRAPDFPLHLIANQPRARLHSQLDVGAHSRATKIKDREPIRMNPIDARARGISDGAVVRVFNERGACLAGVEVSDQVSPGVVQLSTGAWYDPDPADPDGVCRHGNPNVLTSDRPTSRLSQASTGQHAHVNVERFDGPLPELAVLGPPERRLRSTVKWSRADSGTRGSHPGSGTEVWRSGPGAAEVSGPVPRVRRSREDRGPSS
jgi:biotin/methionine sulfoxide reductase